MIRPRHLLPALALSAVGLAAAACGGSSDTPGATTLGTSDHPLVATMPPADKVSADKASGSRQRAASSHHVKATARVNEAAAAPSGSTSETSSSPSYTGILQHQSKHPRTRFSPCNLVTQREAQGIFGALAQEPVEAAQGPTCIYRTQTGKSFVTLAVQSMPFKPLMRQLRGRHTVGVSGRTGYCGSLGQPMVYVPLSRGRLLTVGASCSTGRAFATRAIAQLHD
jgi:hypothetical protein